MSSCKNQPHVGLIKYPACSLFFVRTPHKLACPSTCNPLWERPTALPANACPIQPVHRFKFDHTNASHQRITPPHHTTTPHHRITPPHHTTASHQRITPTHHTTASHQRITPTHHTNASHHRIAPTHHTNASHQRIAPTHHTTTPHQRITPPHHTNASHQRITPPHHTTTPPHKTFLPSAGAVLQTLTIEGADVIPFIHAICTNARASERLSSVTEVVMKVGGW